MIYLLSWLRWPLLAFLVYVAAFMKKEQEGRWENTLQTWLDKVTGQQEGSYAKVTALARAVSGWSERFTARLFGQRLLSLRSFGVSFFYGLASLFLTASLSPLVIRIGYHVRKTPPQVALPHGVAPLNVYWAAFLFVGFLLLRSIPALFNEHEGGLIWMWIFWLAVPGTWIVPLITVVAIVNHLWGYYSALRLVLGIFFLFGLNFLLDVVFVKTTRWALGLASNTRQLWKVVVAILLDVALGYGVIIGPIMLGVYLIKWFFHVVGMMSVGFILAYAMKSIDFVIAVIVFIILALIGVHAVVWFVLERPIYSCLRFRVIRDKKLLWSFIGIVYAAPHVRFLEALFNRH
jgi:hypothetical protein